MYNLLTFPISQFDAFFRQRGRARHNGRLVREVQNPTDRVVNRVVAAAMLLGLQEKKPLAFLREDGLSENSPEAI